jgi:hypothetical protein
MNAIEQIKAIKEMNDLAEVNAVLEAEKASDKPRKTVINACEERIGEITTGGGDEKTPKNEKENAPAPAKKLSEEDRRIMKFNQKVGYVRCSLIESFAKEFFGKDIKSVKTKDYTITISLKSGKSFERRGL